MTDAPNTSPVQNQAEKRKVILRVAEVELEVLTSLSREKLDKIESIIAVNWEEFGKINTTYNQNPEVLLKFCIKLAAEILEQRQNNMQMKSKLDKFVECSDKLDSYLS